MNYVNICLKNSIVNILLTLTLTFPIARFLQDPMMTHCDKKCLLCMQFFNGRIKFILYQNDDVCLKCLAHAPEEIGKCQ